MQLFDVLASLASAATVAGPALGYSGYRAKKRQSVRDLQRKVDANAQTQVIQDAISKHSKSVDDRFDKNDELTAESVRRIDRLEQEQFGPNHGGARQAINELTADVKTLSGNLAKMSERVVRVETILTPNAPARA